MRLDVQAEGITVDIDGEGIATLTVKMPGPVNTIGAAFLTAFRAALEATLAGEGATEGLRGIIVASGHKDFCAGADIDTLFAARDPAQVLAATRALNALYRRLETAGVPVVAAITGAALGGGYELALACHHRIALDDARILIGLPEATLGLIPGAGGTQRLPYVAGLQAALEILAQGGQKRAPAALKAKLVDALAPDAAALHEMARAWIRANPAPKQPWDRGAPLPGGVQPGTPDARNLFTGAAAFLYKKTAGALAAPEAAIKVVHDGLKLTFDRALEVEGRAFARLAVSDQAKDMIRTLWYHRGAVEKQEGLPQVEDAGVRKVVVLGAGMMGAGLGFICAKAGFDVVVRDISPAALHKGQAHVQAQLQGERHLSPAQRQEIQDRIRFTEEIADVAGADLVIEAVIENRAVKHAVIREIEPLLADNAIFASNTSAIPIALLAQASAHPDRFIGMHFFSPVEKMPLLEIIRPDGTSEETLARTLNIARRIKKTAIVVGDGYGFYTTRLFSVYLIEACELVAEGHAPALVEWAARAAGMVMPPLKVFDEVSLALGAKGFQVRAEVTGETLDSPGIRLVRALVEDHGRAGRAAGKGFYDWDTKTLWPGLADLVTEVPAETGLDLLQRRLLLSQAAEVSRILDDGIIRHYRDVEVGAIFGLGFAPNTGGPLAWMDRQGLPALVAEMREMAERYGARYAPSPLLERMAERGERFFPA